MNKPAYVVVALGLAQTLSWGSTYYLPAILANNIAAELGIATTWIFTAFSAGLLISAFFGPAAGRLIDVHGGHRGLPASNVVIAAGLTLLGFAGGLWSLFAAWLVIGVGMAGGLYEAAFSTLARMYGRDARRAITGITLIAGFASTVCWPLSAYMDVEIGWRATCWVWAVAHLLLGVPTNLTLPAQRAVEKPVEEGAAPKGSRRGKLLAMAGLSFVFAATWFCSTAMAAHMPRVLQEAGATLAAAVAASALIGPAQVGARILEFWFMRRFHPIHSARIASLAHPVGAAALLAAGSPAAAPFAAIHGAGNGVMTITMGTLPLALFGAAGYGLRQGLLMAPARVFSASAPFLFDLLLVRVGTSALMVTSALGIAAFAVLMLLPARRT